MEATDSQVSTEHYDGKSKVTTSVEHYDGSQTASGVESRVAENGERNVKNLPLSPGDSPDMAHCEGREDDGTVSVPSSRSVAGNGGSNTRYGSL